MRRTVVVPIGLTAATLVLSSCALGLTARAQEPDTAAGAGQAALHYLNAIVTSDVATARLFECTGPHRPTSRFVMLPGDRQTPNRVHSVTRTPDRRWHVDVRQYARGSTQAYSSVQVYVDHAPGYTEVCFR